MSNTMTAVRHYRKPARARVDTVFGIPGVQTYGLFDAIAAGQGAPPGHSSRHEQATAYMLRYAKSTGRNGVFSVVPVPGC